MPNNPPAKVARMLYAYCCLGTIESCDCINPNHDYALFHGAKAQCIIPNCSNNTPNHEPFCSKHRDAPKAQAMRLPNALAGEVMMTPPKFRTWAEVEAWSLGMMHLADCVSTDALIKMTSLVSRVRADHEHLKPEARND